MNHFVLTEDHIKILRIDGITPVQMARLLGWDVLIDHLGIPRLSGDQHEKAIALLNETITKALKVVLSAQSFEPGVYRSNAKGWFLDSDRYYEAPLTYNDVFPERIV